jgi:hypothetical protein
MKQKKVISENAFKQVVFRKEEKLEDTKGVIRSRKSNKDRQCNGKKKHDITTIYNTLHKQTKDQAT